MRRKYSWGRGTDRVQFVYPDFSCQKGVHRCKCIGDEGSWAKKGRTLIFNCKECKSSGGIALVTDSIAEIKTELSDIKKSMEPVQKIAAMKVDIADLKSKIGPMNIGDELSRIDQEIKNLKDRDLSTESIIEEMNLRNRKVGNFIIYNLKDLNNTGADKDALKETLDKLISNIADMYVILISTVILISQKI